MKLIALTMIRGSIVNEDEIEEEVTTTAWVNPESIRCFYARKNEKAGTRITFTDGGGYAVQEQPQEVRSILINAMQ
jgi:hypothetical protein